MTKPAWQELICSTPLIISNHKSSTYDVFLKLENIQPSGSFKLRGIGNACHQAINKKSASGIISSSGGNAGLAAAYSANKLKVPCTVVVPMTTTEETINKLKKLNATVISHGPVWDVANEKAKEMSEQMNYALIHPFEGQDTWDGHSTIIDEILSQMEDIKCTVCDRGKTPDLIVLSVGGGGLYCGVVEGLRRHGLCNLPVLVMETIGADCFHKAINAGHLMTLPAIKSIAKSLGALTVSPHAFELSKIHPTISRVVSDEQAISACIRFADTHRMLVEPACGASLSAMYENLITPSMFNQYKLCNSINNMKDSTASEINDDMDDDDNDFTARCMCDGATRRMNVVIIVCGGACISMKDLLRWKKEYNSST